MLQTFALMLNTLCILAHLAHESDPVVTCDPLHLVLNFVIGPLCTLLFLFVLISGALWWLELSILYHSVIIMKPLVCFILAFLDVDWTAY